MFNKKLHLIAFFPFFEENYLLNNKIDLEILNIITYHSHTYWYYTTFQSLQSRSFRGVNRKYVKKKETHKSLRSHSIHLKPIACRVAGTNVALCLYTQSTALVGKRKCFKYINISLKHDSRQVRFLNCIVMAPFLFGFFFILNFI